MLVLFETPAGYAIFKLLDEKKLSETENLYQDFETPEAASKVVKLKHFEKFSDTTEALAATTAAVEGKLCKPLKKTLKKIISKDVQDQLLVADAKLGNAIKDKLQLSCVSNTAVQELIRCIRSQMDGLIAGLPKKEMAAMALGLAHSLSRYKLKFSPDKIDTMIVQAVCLLDDLDKELNNYVMRTREWYGWHFPELGKIITDNVAFVKTIKLIGTRDNASSTDLSDILPEEVEQQVKDAAEISMGTEISDDDIINIQHLCDQVIQITQYRAQLYEYLTTRMMAIAPNLTVLIGELVGARLISHAGSLINLAKHPASTIQILGAEKALFRALKTKKDTPKYGLIYHSSLIGQTSAKNKGKMSRMLAAKAALATRVDALGEDSSMDMGVEHKAKLEAKLRLLEEGNLRRISGTGKAKARFEKYHSKSEVRQYPAAADSTLPTGIKRKREDAADTPKKVLIEEISSQEFSSEKKVKVKHEQEELEENVGGGTPLPPKKKVKTEPDDTEFPVEMGGGSVEKKKKKKKIKQEVEGAEEDLELPTEAPEVTETPEIKKKKRKSKEHEAEHAQGLEQEQEECVTPAESGKKKKKKKSLILDVSVEEEVSTPQVESHSEEKKKKKKRKSVSFEESAEGLEFEEPVEDIPATTSDQPESSEKKKKKKKKRQEEEQED
ncbi:nucleolar protein 58 [Schistocerca cancellata]|uniref:nucleolar protein 58 n=1 Tax=Schistocerca cancellata TaxID=274614 RepID=UPI0021189428|nr:nucleolar protein 58 [Schistocerca cancellata]